MSFNMSVYHRSIGTYNRYPSYQSRPHPAPARRITLNGEALNNYNSFQSNNPYKEAAKKAMLNYSGEVGSINQLDAVKQAFGWEHAQQEPAPQQTTTGGGSLSSFGGGSGGALNSFGGGSEPRPGGGSDIFNGSEANPTPPSETAPDLVPGAGMTTSGVAKDFLINTAQNGLTNLQRTNLQRNIRTAQAQRGLEFGGAAVKQEAGMVGRFVQNKRMASSLQLSQLTEQEAMLQPNIETMMSNTGAAIQSSVTPQLTSPTNYLSSLYSGASSGLNSIFNLSGLF